LRQRVTFQQRTLAQDTGGALTPVWSNVATVYAEVRSPAGIERFVQETEQRVATATHQVRFRNGAAGVAIVPSMRVTWRGGRVLEIMSILDPDNCGMQTVAICVEIVEPVSG
jgi:head-tail adaptor